MRKTIISETEECRIYDYVGDWKKFFETRKELFSILIRESEHEPYVIIPLSEILRWSLDYTIELIDSPWKTIQYMKDAIKEVAFSPYETIPEFDIYFSGALKDTPIREIRSKQLGTLVSLEGMVKKATKVNPTIIKAYYRCDRCGAGIFVTQSARMLKPPKKCSVPDCRSMKFELIKTASTFVDTQKLLLQETPESMNSRQGQPQDIEIYVSKHLTGKLLPGQRVIVNGVLVSEETGKGSTALHNYIHVLGYELSDEDYTEIKISEEEETEILRLSKTHDIRDRIVRSIAPSIYGYEHVKEAIALQFFGGVPKFLSSGKRLRGDCHILLIGEPGIAKSDFLRYAYESCPRSTITSGKSSTTAGLTATVSKDEFGDGKWTLDAGALVISDMGLACIDEIGQIESKELSALHEAMEQQRISIAKAGILASLWCRCAILAAANPVKGRFDMYVPIPEQLKLPAPVLSRFDLIFILQDSPTEEFDELVADHILDGHMGLEEHGDIFPPDFLKKYIAYAKKTVFPILSQDAKKILKDYYLKVRGQSAKKLNSPVATTPRQLQALVRLAEANAKMRLSSVVLAEDAHYACILTDRCLKEVAYDRDTDCYDIDRIATGIAHSQRQTMGILQECIKSIGQNNSNGYASKQEIYKAAEGYNIDRGIAEQVLEKMLREQIVYEPKRDMIKGL